jgi:CRP/FNR family transcriptional regulator
MVLSTKAILKQYPFYDYARPALQDEIFEAAQRVYVPEGQVLFDTGHVCEQIVLVGQGCIRVYSHADSGREVSLYLVNPGETCPINIMCVLLGKIAPATAVVAAPLEAITLPALSFQNWVDFEAEVRHFAIESMGDRLIDIIILVEDMVFNHLDIRLADFLRARFDAGQDEHPAVSMSEDEIALALGSTRQVVDRVLHDFMCHGAIKLEQGKIILQNNSLLKEISHYRN